MVAAAWLRIISYSITQNRVYKRLHKLILALAYALCFFQMRSGGSNGKKMNGKFQLSERRKVIDVSTHLNEFLPPLLEPIRKKRESQE